MGWGMRVLVVSDTHRKNDLYIALVERLSPDMVVHCGDVEGSAYTIREAAHAECHIVAGNNDFFDSLPEDDEFMIGRYKAYLTHGHHYYISVGTEMLKDEAKARGFDIVFFGHTPTRWHDERHRRHSVDSSHGGKSRSRRRRPTHSSETRSHTPELTKL